jgi:hypothetical protein
LDTAVDIVPAAVTHSAATNVYNLLVRSGGAQTVPSGTTAVVATARFDEPNITATGTVTDAATVWISGAPTEAGTRNNALLVDSGSSQFDGTVTVGINDTGHDVKFFGATTGKSLLWDESADKLIITGDAQCTGTATGFGSGAFTENVTVANTYGLVVGGTAQQTISDGGGATDVVPEVQVLGTAAADMTALIGGWSTTATRAAAPVLALLKSGNATIASHTVVTDGEILGSIIAYGDDGTDYESPAAAIEFAVDGTPGTGDMPGEIKFYTTADAGETLTLALTLSAAQAATFAGAVTVASLACTAAGTFGGGYGDTGATISTAGVIQANGAITSDGAVTGATLVGTISTATQNSITSASSLATVGTITSGTWSGVIDGSCTMTLGSDATGDVYFRDASGFLEKLAASTDGHVLTSTGAGSIPAWEAIPAAGATLTGSTNNTVTTVTGSNAFQGEANLTFDGTTLGVVGNAGVGIARTDGTLHVHTATAGSVTANTNWDDLVVENSGHGGIAILVPDDMAARITFGSPSATGDINAFVQGHYNSGTEFLGFGVANSEKMRVGDLGQVWIGDSVNANMTIGLTINQAANDDEILAFKSSDIDHGMTAYAETDTYGHVKKANPNSGGLMFETFSEPAGSQSALILRAWGGSVNTTKSASALGALDFQAGYNNSGTAADLTTNGNLMVLRQGAAGTTRYIWDVEGSGHADIEWTTYADHDDLRLISDMETTLLATEHPSQTPRRHAMEATGIIGEDSWHMEDGKPKAMVNFTKLAMLHHGALIQTSEKLNHYEDRIAQLEAQVANLLEN